MTWKRTQLLATLATAIVVLSALWGGQAHAASNQDTWMGVSSFTDTSNVFPMTPYTSGGTCMANGMPNIYSFDNFLLWVSDTTNNDAMEWWDNAAGVNGLFYQSELNDILAKRTDGWVIMTRAGGIIGSPNESRVYSITIIWGYLEKEIEFNTGQTIGSIRIANDSNAFKITRFTVMEEPTLGNCFPLGGFYYPPNPGAGEWNHRDAVANETWSLLSVTYPSFQPQNATGSGTQLYNKIFDPAGLLTVNYPAGYDGEMLDITSQPPAPPPVVNYHKPNILIDNVVNWRMEFRDTNFLTFDKYPFICDDGYAPLISWTMYNATDPDNQIIVDAGLISASSTLTFQFEVINEVRNYALWTTYTQCEGHDFQAGSAIKIINISEAGIQVPAEEDLLNCLSDEAPYIHIGDCIESFKNILTALTGLGGVTILSQEIQSITEGCRTTQTIHTWILLPDPATLCPQVSAEIRNVITPAITLLLGAVLVKGLVSAGRKDEDTKL